MRVYELAKELGVEYEVLYKAADELEIKMKKHHQSSIDPDTAAALRKHLTGESEEPQASNDSSDDEESKGKKKARPVSDGTIVINADVKEEQKKEKELIIPDEPDDLEIFEEETGKRFSKEERHKRQSKKLKSTDYKSTKEDLKLQEKKKKSSSDKEDKPEVTRKIIQLPEYVTLDEFSEKVEVAKTEIIKKLMMLGVTNVAQPLDFDVATLIAEDFGFDTEPEPEKDELGHIIPKGELRPRPPVVTIMGHVDHGKTTLLDNIRKTNVVAREAGGITQHIGAYQIEWKKKLITFIDTPGHEAFTEMRAHGANVTDIAIIIVAADDGLKPQSHEAIDHARAAKVPIIIAINKIDRPGANPDKVKQELANVGLVPEDWGGNTICVEISAKFGDNIEELLEMIVLVTEMEDLKGEYDVPAAGVIIESYKHKAKGPLATVLVQKGVITKGNVVVSGIAHGKIRAMFDEWGKEVERAEASKPIEIMGLSDAPQAGEKIRVVANEKLAREIAQKHLDKIKEAKNVNKVKSLDALLQQAAGSEKKSLSIILKTDVRGSAIAIKDSLEKLSDEEVEVSVIHSGVGVVSETDVNLAVASNAVILGFNIRVNNNARKLAEKEAVEIRTYNIIYDAIEDVKNIMKGLYDKIYVDVVVGQATVLTTFKVPKIGIIAGCKVDNGIAKRKAKAKLYRDGAEIYSANISSLKRFKDDVSEVASGYECGVGIENYNDLKEGDVIEFIEQQEEERD